MDFLVDFTHYLYAFLIRHAHDNSFCAFACALTLRPELVESFRTSLTNVPTRCAIMLSVESVISRKLLRSDFFGLCTTFLRTRSTVSSNVVGCLDHFFLCKPPSFFVTCPNLHCCWQLLCELTHK